ncbi:uncharacterized protein LOC117344142 [Pecten maximus]|uniref:uncharacterized protein LOC117344142 n=1 Tax=Pecten maximus TaxID=6579 RepID=UPI00145827A2|nr:uncharacterized protein LOC117344142 [Pecten maximus]
MFLIFVKQKEMKAYDCIVCRKRVNPRDRRPVPKASKKIVSKLICRQVTSDDQICSKCRLKALRSKKQATTSSGDDQDKQTVTVKETLKSPQNIQLNIKSTPRNNKRCVICKKSKNLTRVGSTAISQAFIDKGVYINSQSRCCREHMQRSYFTTDALTKLSATKKSEFFSRTDITALMNGIRDNVKAKGHIDFDNPAALSTEEYTNITGLSKDQFHDLAGQLTSSVRNNSNRSSRTCLAIFMAKMKTGLPNAILGTIFNLNTAQVQRIIPRVRQCLMETLVPTHLGFGHLAHNDFIEKHTTTIAKELFTTGKEAVLVLDGTYLYIQKSMDYKFQRMSYSLHKNRPLVKPMMVVGTDGYILSVLGPYLADYGNNDASITKHVLNHNLEEIRTWLKKDDVFIVDRGFRDAVEYLEKIGLKVEMPAYLAKGKKQHTTEESNLSRLVTKVNC